MSLEVENARLRQWVNDLQRGMYVNCVYCGHRYGPGETTPVSMADALKAHIQACPHHPMFRLKIALMAAYHAMSSVRADRNGITDELLADIIAVAEAALKYAGGEK